jgi:hypothetical protein
MDRAECIELHYISPIANVSSILERGVLSHRLASRVPHTDVSMEEVQDRRALVRIPRGLALHEYANLYFNARNTMMYKRAGSHAAIAILRIRAQAVDISNVVMSDMNAASDYVSFGTPDEMFPRLDRDRIFARDWTDPDAFEQRRHRREMCAEVLIPRFLPAEYIEGAYVSCEEARATLAAAAPTLEPEMYPYMFFRGEPR